MTFRKIGAGKAVLLFVWTSMAVHFDACREAVWYFECKERPDKVWILRHEAHHLQCRSICSKSCMSDWKFDCSHSSAFFFFFVWKCDLWNRSWASWRTVVGSGYNPDWALVTVACVLYSINWLVFITETECVYCVVRNGSLYILRFHFTLQSGVRTF